MSTSSQSSGLLEGVRVLDMTRILAGPYCAQTLGDLGADVIKVERPLEGDYTRGWGPPFTDSGQSAYFLCANRNKRGMTLDFQKSAGQEVLRDLIKQSDVLIENFRAGTLERMGFGWEELKQIKEDLIYCTITGFGYDSPHSHEGGYDFMIQARGGLMSITGDTNGSPMKVGVAIADLVTGLYAASAIQGALFAREKGRGPQRIDLALLDAQVAMLINVASNFLVSGDVPTRFGNAHPNIVPYEAFDASDGTFTLGIGSERHWRSFCDAIERSDWTDDPRFLDNAARVKNRELLSQMIGEIAQGRTVNEWLHLLESLGIPCAPIQSVDQVFSDPRVVAREMSLEMDHSSGAISLLAPAFKIPTSPASVRRLPPMLGEHTHEILNEVLGYDTLRVDNLIKEGVI